MLFNGSNVEKNKKIKFKIANDRERKREREQEKKTIPNIMEATKQTRKSSTAPLKSDNIETIPKSKSQRSTSLYGTIVMNVMFKDMGIVQHPYNHD